ncbi:MAG: GntR family transcriptional regulator [Propionicimonas sp.]|nr:GntR family transcriptional regulator [Propionicimonas sp.]
MAQEAIAPGPVPKHLQVRDRIIALCVPDQAIPSERELMASYGVSRATVRKAIDGLVADGLLHRTQGLGTFAVRPRVESTLHLASFTTDMRRRGLTPSTRLLGVSLLRPPPEVAANLALGAREQAWRITRIRLADGQPIAHEAGWYSGPALPDLDRQDLEGESLYQIMGATYGLWIDKAVQVLWGESASTDLAGLLAAPVNTPLLVFKRTSSASGRPIEDVVSRYRGDRYELHMELRSGMLAAGRTPHERNDA